MVKVITVLLILLSNTLNYSSTDIPADDLNKLRSLLYNSTANEESLDSLFSFITALKLNNYGNNNPVLLAYNGVGKALLAKYSFFPWDKLNNVNNGLRMMDQAVALDKNNLEIRFLRFSVLSNIPSFLGYSSEADKEANIIYKMLKDNKHTEDTELIKNVVDFLIASERLDKNKQEHLSKIYSVVIK